MKATGYLRGKPIDIDLIEVQTGKYLVLAAAHDFLRMQIDAEKAGHTLHINSAFREMAHQEHLYDKFLKELAEWEVALRDGKATADDKPLPVARPGYSNHQSGTAVDIQRKGNPELDKWLAKNAKTFNFYRTVAREMHHWDHKLS